MKDKSIGKTNADFLSRIQGAASQCFSIQDAYSVHGAMSKDAVKKALRDLVRLGWLIRLKEGLYHIVPFEQDSETFMPNWHLIAGKIAGTDEHYIGYYSALEIHGLITQPSLTEQVVINKRINPSVQQIRNIQVQFIYHNEKHFFGAKKTWIDKFNKVLCSDLEKTFIDCLFKPQYAGGMIEIGKALDRAKEKVNLDQLLEYVRRFQSQSVIKRLGMLMDILEIEHSVKFEFQKLITPSFTPFDPTLPKSGTTVSKWRVQMNISAEEVREALFT